MLATTNGGSTWKYQTLPTANNSDYGVTYLDSISCATTSDCVAVGGAYEWGGQVPDIFGLVLFTTTGGSTWTESSAGDGGLISVSCPNASSCWAVGNNVPAAGGGPILVAISDGGSAWTSETPPSGVGDLSSITCVSASDCWAVGSDSSGDGVVIATTNGGSSWIVQSPPDGAEVGSITCVSDSDCWAPASNSSDSFVIATTNGGSSWIVQSLPDGAAVGSITCVSDSDCWAPASNASGSFVVATINGGNSWIVQPLPSGADLEGIWCVSTSNCWAFGSDSSGHVVVDTTDGGSTWVVGTAEIFPGGPEDLNGVSCPTTSDCWATGSDALGNATIIATTDGGGTWVPETLPSSVESLDGLSCVNNSDCWALASTASGSVVIATTDGGSTWAPQTLPSGVEVRDGISCASTSDCWALGTDSASNNIVVSTSDGGSTWSAETLPAGGYGLASISCPNTSDCWAAGIAGTGNAAFVVASTDGGTSWTTETVPSNAKALDGISCADASDCIAVGDSGLYQDTQAGTIIATTDGGDEWTMENSRDPSLYNISCPSASDCTAVGYFSQEPGDFPIVSPVVLATTDGGTTWTGQTASPPAGVQTLWGVSCASTSDCWAVGDSETWPFGAAFSTAPTAPSITSSDSDAFSQGVADNFTVTTVAAPTPSLSETGALPSGVTFTDNGNGTAFLAGTASGTGSFPITITASNGVSPDASQTFTLTVNPPVAAWTDESPTTSPAARVAASMAYDPTTDQLLLFGGSPSGGTYDNDTWAWNGTTWTELFPATSPPARSNASLAYDSATGQLILFGGIGAGATYLNDTWAWNGTTWTELSPATSPPVRYNASMSYDTATSQLILFGGVGNSTATGGDTWSWNGTTWAQLSPATSPPARSRAGMTYDGATGQIVLFGGFAASGYLNDTWTWNGATWTELSPAVSPSVRSFPVMALDTVSNEVVLFGGYSGSKYLSDTWTFNGSNWVQLSPAVSPPGRSRAASAFYPDTGQLIIFGGGGTAPVSLGDTWAYGPTVPGAPSIGTATAGAAEATVSFNPPPSNGGSAVLSYTVTAADSTTPTNGGETASSLGSPVTLTGLSNGDSYSFSVTATNAVGTGPASAPSNVVVPATIPSAPSIGVASASNAEGSVSFSPPSSNGGSPVTSYTVTAADSTTPANGGETASGSSSPVTVTGLTNGDSYTFSVTATNSAGTGPASAPSNAVVPSALTIASVTPSHLVQGSKISSLVIGGTGFVSPLSVTISGGGVSPTLVSVASAAVTIGVKVNAQASLGARDVTVTDPNGSVTCAGCLTITARPTLTSASPPSLAAGTSTSVTFQGSGFEPGATITFTGHSPSVKAVKGSIVVTSTTLKATIKVPARAITGAYAVKITNPDHSSVTCTSCFSVTPGKSRNTDGVASISSAAAVQVLRASWLARTRGTLMKRLTTFARDVELADEWVNASAAALTVLSAPAAGRWVSKLGIKSGLRLPSGADPTD